LPDICKALRCRKSQVGNDCLEWYAECHWQNIAKRGHLEKLKWMNGIASKIKAVLVYRVLTSPLLCYRTFKLRRAAPLFIDV
jgi:hypothetical protein